MNKMQNYEYENKLERGMYKCYGHTAEIRNQEKIIYLLKEIAVQLNKLNSKLEDKGTYE